MVTLQDKTIIEMMEYAQEKKISIPTDASKSEVLELILPYHLSELSIMEIRDRAYNNGIAIPSSKNKSELISNALEIYTIIYKHGNYETLFERKLSNFRSYHSSYETSNDSFFMREVDELIKSVPHPADMPTENKFATTILSKPEHIKNYLLHVIHLETETDFLKKYISYLNEQIYHCKKNRDAVRDICENYMKNKIAHEAYDLYGRLEKLQYMKNNPKKYLLEQSSIVDKNGNVIENPRYWKLTKPKAPSQPYAPRTAKPIPPEKPNYARVPLFNRKKVLEENEALKKKYDIELGKYNVLLTKYQAEQERYSAAMAEYKAKYAEYEKLLNEYNLKLAEQKKMSKIFDKTAAEVGAEQSIQAIDSEIKSTKKQIDAIVEQNKALCEEIFESMLEQVLYEFLCNERKKARKELKETLKALNEMYAYNVVYKKYRELPILTTLYEYINSRRCYDLRGGDGAYNLYESELRANIIFTKLDNISASLETIKANQLMLYTEIKQVNRNLESANDGIKKIVYTVTKIDKKLQKSNSMLTSISESLEKIDKSTQETARNTAQSARNSEITAHNSNLTAYNTQVAAYNSAITAQYSRVAASRLDSIEFMMSLQ